MLTQTRAEVLTQKGAEVLTQTGSRDADLDEGRGANSEG